MSFTLISTIVGFLGSVIPELVGAYKEKQLQKHERALAELQLKASQQNINFELDKQEIQASLTEQDLLVKNLKTGIKWVDAANGAIRPIVAYMFLGLYLIVKVGLIVSFMVLPGAHLGEALASAWGLEDQTMFSTIIGFYFGSRAFLKIRSAYRN